MDIDGGIICNNPGLYAYQLAKIIKGKKKIRLLSLGTGEKKFSEIEKGTEFTKMKMLSKLGEFMMNMDTYSADLYL